MTGLELAAAAAERGGLLPWILAGLVLGLLIGFAYAAIRRLLGRRSRRG